MKKDANAKLLPELAAIKAVSKTMAFAVGKAAQKDGVALATSDAELKASIERNYWELVYRVYSPRGKS